MWIPDGGVIALEKRVVGVRENLSGVDPLDRVYRPCHGAFCRGEKNYTRGNKICRFCLLANNFNFIFA